MSTTAAATPNKTQPLRRLVQPREERHRRAAHAPAGAARQRRHDADQGGAGARARLRPGAGLGHGRLAGLGPGDGLFGLDRAARQPALRAPGLRARLLPHAPRGFGGDRLHRRAAGLPDSDGDLGARGALALRRFAAAAGRGADPAHRHQRQRRAPLAADGLHALPAFRAGQARDDPLRRQLHGAQDGDQGALLPRRAADGHRGGGGRHAGDGASPTWAPSW